MTVICYCGAGPLVKAFLENDDAFGYGMSFARIYIYSGPILGILFVFINAIQSTGAAFPSLILSVSRQGLLYIPILLAINQIFKTPKTLAMSQPITDYLATALSFIIFVFTYKKYFKDF